MARSAPTKVEAIEQSEHVLYEIQMLGALRGHFLYGDHDRAVASLPLAGLASRNALVEAFQIHARQLIDFLTDRSSPRQATAGDFTAERWSLAKRDRKALKRLSGEFSQRVAHLAWRRSQLNVTQQRVMTEEIFDAIRNRLLLFVELVDPDRVCPGFAEEAVKAMFAPAGGDSDARHGATSAANFPGGTATSALRPPTPGSG